MLIPTLMRNKCVLMYVLYHFWCALDNIPQLIDIQAFFATLAWLIPLNMEQMCLEDVLDDLDGGGWCQVSQTGACQTATSPFLPKKGPSHHHNKKKWDRSEWSASMCWGAGSGIMDSEKLSICLTGYSYFLHQNFLRLLYAKPSSRRSLLRNPNI